jgi:phage baseplate assembly protein W
MARNTRTFSDLDLNFIAHPGTGDVTLKYDEEAIKQSVKNLVLTQHYERPFHSEVGSSLRGLLFEPATPMLATLIQRSIIDTITNFEPRVRLIDVYANVSPDNHEVYVRIEFAIVNTTTPIKVDLVLTRTR